LLDLSEWLFFFRHFVYSVTLGTFDLSALDRCLHKAVETHETDALATRQHTQLCTLLVAYGTSQPSAILSFICIDMLPFYRVC
jgi:hypothetical protein